MVDPDLFQFVFIHEITQQRKEVFARNFEEACDELAMMVPDPGLYEYQEPTPIDYGEGEE